MRRTEDSLLHEMLVRYRPDRLISTLLMIVATLPPALSAQDDPSGVVDVVALDEIELVESSGLAISRRRENYFWSHNDSGGTSRIYAFDRQGRRSGHIDLNTVHPVDWEDMASFVDQGVPRLLVADCGDNQAARPSITLHLLDEPDPLQTGTANCLNVTVRYPDGP